MPDDGLPAAIVQLAGDAQTGVVGQRLTDTLVVRVTDSKSPARPVAAQKIVFQAVAGGTGAILIPDTTLTDIDGKARSVWVLGTLVGAQRVEARVIATGAAGTLKTAFTATALADLPDTVFALAGNNQSGVVGSILPVPLTVVVTDQFGNPLSGLTVTWSVPPGQGSVSAATTVTSAAGQASVTRTLGPGSGAQTASAAVTGVASSPVVFHQMATAGGATSLVITRGNNPPRTAPVGFQDSIVVRLLDANGNGVPSGSITWAPAQGGSVAPALSQTDANGYAFTFWTFGPAAGPQNVTATAAPSGLQVTISGTATASQPTTLARASGNPASFLATVGQAVGPAPSVKVTDQNGNPVQGVNVDFVVTGGNGQVSNGSVTGSRVTILTDATGIATLTAWTLGPVAGANSMEAQAVDAASAPLGGSPVGWTATGQAGSAAQVVITGQPAATAQSGVVFGSQPSVQLQDQFGNAVAQSGVAVTATVAGGGATLRGTLTAITNSGGAASFSGLNLVGPAGSYSLVLAVPGLTSATTQSITLSAGPAAVLAITTQPSASATSGVALAQQPVVQLRDSAGNDVAQSGILVTVALASGGGSLTGTLAATTGGSGAASFTGLTITGAAGARTFSFTAPGLASAVSSAVTLGAGSPTTLALTTQPSATSLSGSLLVQQPVIQLKDASGNDVAQAGVSIAATITGAPAGVTLGGTASIVTNASGTAAYTDLALTGPAGSYTLTFAASGLSSITSTAIQLLAGSATQIFVVTQPPAAAQSGVVLVPAVVLQLQDGTGNNVAQANVALTAAISSGPGGSVGGTVTVQTAANGSATFSNLSISGPVGSYTLIFSGTSLTSAVSTGITLSAGSAAALSLTTAPDPAPQNGVAFATQPRVQLVDGAGNLVAVSGTSIAATVLSGPAGSTLTGATAITGGTGLASFSGLTLTGSVGSYTLQFTAAGGLTPVASGALVLSAGAPASMTKTLGDNQTGTVGSTLPVNPTVLITDASGNPVPGTTVTFAVTNLFGGSVGSPTAVTDAAGLASTTWTLRALLGTNTISATSSTGAVSFTATGVPGLAGQLSITTQPSASAASGVILAQQPVVQLEDLLGNPVNTSGVAISATASAGTLQGATTAVTTNGVATFTNLSLTGTAGSYTLTFSGNGLSGATSSTIALGAGAAARLVVVTVPSATAASGTPFAVQPVVEVQDASGNPVSGTRNVSALVAGGTLSGTNPVSTGGGSSAAFTNLAIIGSAGAKTLTFTSGSLTPDSAVVTITAGGAASVSANSSTSQSATVGSAVGTPPSVIVRDGAGNPVAGATVTFAVTAGGGSVVGASQTTNGAGVATVTSWTLGTTVGGNTVTATVTGSGISGNPVSFTATGTAGPAAILLLNSGNSQSATVNTSVATAPSVKVTDANNNAVAGTQVTFAVASGGGSVIPLTAVTTSASGIAAPTSWTLGTAAGSNTLSATATGLTGSPIVFTATGTAGVAATLTKAAGDNQTASVGSAVAIAPQVLVVDPFGNPKSGISVTFAPTAGSGSVTGGTTTTNTSGLATVGSWTLGATAGTNSLTATATGGGISGNPATFTATGTAGGPASVVANSVTTQTTTVGTAVAAPPSVIVRDGASNPVAGVTVTFAITGGTGGSLAGATQTTNGAGVATVTSWTIDTTVKSNTVTATVTGGGISGNPVSFTATGIAATAAKLIVNRQPSTTAQSGVAFPTTPRIQVADQYNNAVATAPGVLITATVLTSPGGSPVLTNASATTTSAGLATFTNFTLSGLAGSYSFQFDASAAGLGAVASNAVTLTPGLATGLSITTEPPGSSTSGAVLIPAPSVQLVDGAGNAVSQLGTAITAAVASGPGGSTLTGNVATTSSAGLATFNSLALSGSSGSYTLSFTGPTQPAVTSTAIVLGAGSGTKLAITTQPSSSVVNGTSFPQQPVIQLQDAASNPVNQAGVSVNVIITSGGGTLGGTTTAVSNSSGQAIFTNLQITGLTGNRTLLFAASGFSTATSNVVNVTVGPPALIAVSAGNGQSATAGFAVATAPAVVLTDVSGQPVANISVTFAVSGGGGSVSGSPAVSNSSGIATLGSWTLGTTAGGNSLTATATGSGIAGNPLTFTATGVAGSASQLVMLTQPSGSAQSGIAFGQQPSVRLADQFGNTVTTTGTPVTAAIGSGGGALSGTVTVNTVSGVAAFSGLTITGLAGAHTLSFTSGILTPATSNTITLGSGTATTIALSAGDGQSTTVGTAVGTSPAVLVTDGSANPVSGVTVTFAVATGGGSATGTTAVTGSNGIATVGSWTLGNIAGSNSLTATASGLGGSPVTFTATGIAGSASQLIMLTQPSNSAQSGIAFGQQPSVRLEDQFGNIVTTSGTPVTVAIGSGGGSLSGTTTVNTSSGVASFSGLSITGLVGGHTLDFSSSGLTGTSSSTITLSAGTATTIALSAGDGQSTTVNTAVSTSPEVLVTDGAGNPVGGVSVTFAVASGGGSVSGGSTTTGLNGIAAVGSWTLGTTAGGNSLTATSGSLGGSPVTFTATGLADIADHLLFTVQPTTTKHDKTITPAVEVSVVDQFGNLVTSATDAVTLTIAVDGSGGGAVLSGTLTVNAVGGVASFGDLSIDLPGNGYQLNAGAGGLTDSLSALFDIT